MEFFCLYCKRIDDDCDGWITDTVHGQNLHNRDLNGLEKQDEWVDYRVRVDGVIYIDEEEYLERKGGA